MGAPPLDPRDMIIITVASGGYHVAVSAVHPATGEHRVLEPTFQPSLALARQLGAMLESAIGFPVHEELQAGAAND